KCDCSADVCSSDLGAGGPAGAQPAAHSRSPESSLNTIVHTHTETHTHTHTQSILNQCGSYIVDALKLEKHSLYFKKQTHIILMYTHLGIHTQKHKDICTQIYAHTHTHTHTQTHSFLYSSPLFCHTFAHTHTHTHTHLILHANKVLGAVGPTQST